jgi:hypothetical protein
MSNLNEKLMAMEMVELYRRECDFPGFPGAHIVLYDLGQESGSYITGDMGASYWFAWDEEGKGWRLKKRAAAAHSLALAELRDMRLRDKARDLRDEMARGRREKWRMGAVVGAVVVGAVVGAVVCVNARAQRNQRADP